MVFSDHKIVFLWTPRWVISSQSGETRLAWLCRVVKSSNKWSTRRYSLECWYNLK